MTTAPLSGRCAHLRRSRRLTAAFLAAATIPSASLLAATSTWTGVANANWSNPTNWSPASAYPNSAATDVVINSAPVGTFAPTLDVGATIATLSLTSNALLTLNSGISLAVSAGTISNAGTVTITGNSTYGSSTLSLSQNTTLSGGGIIQLSNSTFSYISGSTLTNVDNTISGAGYIYSNLTNQATVEAVGGTLHLVGNVTNTGGTLAAAADGIFQISSNVTAGTLSIASGGQVTGSSTLTNMTLTGTSNWSIVAGTSSPALAGTFTNHGNITLQGNGTYGGAYLQLPSTGTTTLNGGGTINLSNSSFSLISSGNLTNVDNTLQGTGTIYANITNQSAIIAQSGTLFLNGHVDNTAGSLSVAANGSLSVSDSVTGGTLTAVAGAQVTGSGSLANVTLTSASAWTILSGASSPHLTGTFTNQGNITLQGNGTYGGAYLQLPSAGSLTLNGGGTVTLTNATYSTISSGNLTNVDNAITGAGYIYANLTNHGTLTASGGTLTLAGTFDNSNGTVNIAANGTLALTQTFTGGSINVASGGKISGTGNFANTTINGNLSVTSGQFTNVALASGSTLTIPVGQLQLSGTFTNYGTVTLLGNGTVGGAILALPSCSTVSLAGGGTINLSNASYSAISTGTLINVDNTIQGTGYIYANLTNQASLIAQGGTLSLSGPIDNTAGNVSVLANGSLVVSSPLTGGTLSVASGGSVSGSSSLANITLSSTSVWTVHSGTSTPALAGTFTNHGNITLLGNGTNGSATISLANTPVTLNGGGTVTLTNSAYSTISTGNLTNVDNTLQGAGIITATLTNLGNLHASGGTLSLNGNVLGNGTATVDANASLSASNFTQSSLTNNGTFTMSGNGTIPALQGNGTLAVSGHLLLPSNSPLPRQGALSLTGAGALDITNNKMILQPASKPSALSAAQSAAANGSLTSSTLPAGYGIAVVDNAVLGSPFATFGGDPVNSGSILITTALLGDADINGKIDLNDLNIVLNHLGTTDPAWSSGNFDHAATIDLNDLNNVLNTLGVTYANNAVATVDLNDLNDVLNNLGTTYPNNAAVNAAESLLAGSTPAPEPASLAIAALGLPLLLRRRR